MEVKQCAEFYYRIIDENMDVYKEFNTSPENVIRNNPKIKFYVGEVVKIKVNDYSIHIVKPMETLREISQIYGLDEDKIFEQNDLKSKRLFIGQQLKIYKNNN